MDRSIICFLKLSLTKRASVREIRVSEEQLTARYHDMLAKLRDAEAAAQRPSGSVKLLAVSKNHPISAIRCLLNCGQQDFAESRVQEALTKIQAFATPPTHAPIWHFIGPLQSNKTRAIAEHFSWVHSLARVDIALRLQAARSSALAPLQVCVQINCAPQSERIGVLLKDLLPLCDTIAQCDRLQLRGLMAMPPPTLNPAAVKHYFHQVRVTADELRQQGFLLDTLSMGMSQDFPLAIQEGATWVRIGTALFGARTS